MEVSADGPLGNPQTLVWLFCELHQFGKTLVRKGSRREIDPNRPPIWVFCPLLKDKFPRDRVLVSACSTCSHFRGTSHSLDRIKVPSQAHSPISSRRLSDEEREHLWQLREMRRIKEQFLRAAEDSGEDEP